MTTWLVTGAGGMLGRAVVAALAAAGVTDVCAASRADLDITDGPAVREAVSGRDVVVNTAAWTDVDRAEIEEVAATAVNGFAVETLARSCRTGGARLIQLSTDYVFDGTAPGPYRENAPVAPVNAYGRGKLVGEQALAAVLPDRGYVVRTAWLYGVGGRSFVDTMMRRAEIGHAVSVIDDQYGAPTWCGALAERIVALGRAAMSGRAKAGIYHGTAGGETTWYGVARAVYTAVGADPSLVSPTDTTSYRRTAPRAARRPAYAVLGQDRWATAGFDALPHWQTQLAEGLAAMRAARGDSAG